MAEHRPVRKKFTKSTWAWAHRNKRQRQTHQRPKEEPLRWQDSRGAVGLERYLAASDRRGARLVEEEDE
jgi:hypothetical protein